VSGPTPEQQADYLVRKLEQTIRERRGSDGMSFRSWQTIAREEIANSLRDADRRRRGWDRVITRLILTCAASLTTVGFWGAMVAIERGRSGLAATITLVAGLALLFAASDWGLARFAVARADRRRRDSLIAIEDLDLRIKRMETSLRRKAEQLEEQVERERASPSRR